MNGSRPFGGRETDGGGLTKVMPSTVGDTEGLTDVVGGFVDVPVAELLAVVVAELVDVAVTDALAVTDGLAVSVGELVDVVVTEGLVVVVAELVGEGLAGHALPPGLLSAKSRITV